MEFTKNGIKGLGALALVGVLGASIYFVAMPQLTEAFGLQAETAQVNDNTSMREIRLAKLTAESENISALTDNVNDLLVLIPSSKDVTGIAGAVVNAMPPGVQLISFSHGDLIETGPNYVLPEVTLGAIDPLFELTVPGEKKATPAPKEGEGEGEETTTSPVEEETPTVSAFAAAPFILEVEASGVESLNNFLDLLQFQDRLIAVVSVDSSSEDGGVTKATIYAYAFAGSTPQIQAWENPPAEAE